MVVVLEPDTVARKLLGRLLDQALVKRGQDLGRDVVDRDGCERDQARVGPLEVGDEEVVELEVQAMEGNGQPRFPRLGGGFGPLTSAANSMPVGPPPTTTKWSSLRRSASEMVGCAAISKT